MLMREWREDFVGYRGSADGRRPAFHEWYVAE
jgi:hypothetical protein